MFNFYFYSKFIQFRSLNFIIFYFCLLFSSKFELFYSLLTFYSLSINNHVLVLVSYYLGSAHSLYTSYPIMTYFKFFILNLVGEIPTRSPEFNSLKFNLRLFIFLPCCHPPSDMALTFIFVQYFSDFLCLRRIYLQQSFRYILMYCTLTNSKLFGALSYRSIIFNYVVSTLKHSFFNIWFQKNLCREHTFYILCKGFYFIRVRDTYFLSTYSKLYIAIHLLIISEASSGPPNSSTLVSLPSRFL